MQLKENKSQLIELAFLLLQVCQSNCLGIIFEDLNSVKTIIN